MEIDGYIKFFLRSFENENNEFIYDEYRKLYGKEFIFNRFDIDMIEIIERLDPERKYFTLCKIKQEFKNYITIINGFYAEDVCLNIDRYKIDCIIKIIPHLDYDEDNNTLQFANNVENIIYKNYEPLVIKY